MEELKEIISCHINKIRNDSEFMVHNKDTNIELAELAGVKKSCLYDVFNGTASVDSMMKVVKVLDTNLYDHIIKLIKETTNTSKPMVYDTLL